MKKALLIILALGLAIAVFARPGKVTKLWFPVSAPPGPPGLDARVEDGMPLPGGRIYVSPEEFEAKRRREMGSGTRK